MTYSYTKIFYAISTIAVVICFFQPVPTHASVGAVISILPSEAISATTITITNMTKGINDVNTTLTSIGTSIVNDLTGVTTTVNAQAASHGANVWIAATEFFSTLFNSKIK